MKLKALLLSALTVFAVTAAQAKAVEGTDYIVRSNEIKPVQSDKIEVTEFFGYFCIHCQHLEPIIEQQSKRFASDTVLRQEHVVWQPAHQTLARLAAAVKSTGLSRQANQAIFKALMDGVVTDETSLKNWIPTAAACSPPITARSPPPLPKPCSSKPLPTTSPKPRRWWWAANTSSPTPKTWPCCRS